MIPSALKKENTRLRKEVRELHRTIDTQESELHKVSLLQGKSRYQLIIENLKIERLYDDTQMRELEYHRFLQIFAELSPDKYQDAVVKYNYGE